MPPFPIYVIPYPLPIVPSPSSCPCYLLNPGQNNTASNGQPTNAPQRPPSNQNQVYAPYGIIGYIPVVFIPYCPGQNSNMNNAQENFPEAVPVQYNCPQCEASRDFYRYFGRFNGGRSTGFKDLKELKSLAELDDLLKNKIKPMKTSIRNIAAHPRILEDTNEKSVENNNEKLKIEKQKFEKKNDENIKLVSIN